MCVNMLQMASSFGGGLGGGGAMQAAGGLMNSIASLAGGSAKAGVLRAEADMVRTGAQMRAGAIRREAQQQTGAARAAAVASGVSVNSGSVLQAEQNIARYSEQDALSAIISGEAKAGALQSQARGARTAGAVDAGDSLLVAADNWKRTRRPGADVGRAWEGIRKEDWR